MTSKDVHILDDSNDRQLLMKTSIEFARSSIEADQKVLQQHMIKADFLARLDSDDDYLGPPKNLRLARVMKTLMDNPSPYSGQVLVSFAKADDFVSSLPRQELLIRALIVVRPAPNNAVQYWDQHSQPDSPFLHVTIRALADNGSPPAVSLLAKKMADPALEDDDKVCWMRDAILRHRNEVPMLEACTNMLKDTLPWGLRPYLVEALFDYQRRWYVSCDPPSPPPFTAMTLQACNLLEAIGNYSLQNVTLNDLQKAAVKRGLAQIQTKMQHE